jgi:nitrite reductase/ring-hydroxylating ferredoxin subunit
MLVEVAKVGDVAPGGMVKAVAGGKEVVLCHAEGGYYAVSRRCGHMNAPLEMGSLDGFYLTCPMHRAQFDVRTGEALNYPVYPHRHAPMPKPARILIERNKNLMFNVEMHDLGTYPVKVEGDLIKVEVQG